MAKMKEWLAVDLDGTLASYANWAGPAVIGKPIPNMIEKVKKVLRTRPDVEVRVFTARCFPIVSVVREDADFLTLKDRHDEDGIDDAIKAVQAIQKFTQENFGQVLPVTCVKDYGMFELWDDRAIQVVPNTGDFVGQSRRGLV